MSEKTVEKLLSGRFLLTVIIGITFAILSIGGKLSSDKIIEVILIVIYGYFTRVDRKPENGGIK